MVVLNKIYTRTGDAGTTALGTGERVSKHSPRIAAYGTVDETNAADRRCADPSGRRRIKPSTPCWAASRTTSSTSAPTCARPSATDVPPKRERLRVSDAQIKRLEDEIDAMNAELTPLRSFVLPGGSAGGGGAARCPHGVPPGRARRWSSSRAFRASRSARRH